MLEVVPLPWRWRIKKKNLVVRIGEGHNEHCTSVVKSQPGLQILQMFQYCSVFRARAPSLLVVLPIWDIPPIIDKLGLCRNRAYCLAKSPQPSKEPTA
jgi:hypothetical protein